MPKRYRAEWQPSGYLIIDTDGGNFVVAERGLLCTRTVKLLCVKMNEVDALQTALSELVESIQDLKEVMSEDALALAWIYDYTGPAMNKARVALGEEENDETDKPPHGPPR